MNQRDVFRDVKKSPGRNRRENWIVDESSGCWIWQGPFAPSAKHGYGPYKRIYEQRLGAAPKGFDLHHTCRNGSGACVNPYHLELMPMSEHRKMHRHETSKLTLDQAKEIRRRLVDEIDVSTEILAADYGVTRFILERIGAGTYWPDAGGTPLLYTVECRFCGAKVVSTKRNRRFCDKAHQRKFNAYWGWRRRRYGITP